MVGATLWNHSPVSVKQATPIARLTGEYEVIAVPTSSPLRETASLIGEFRRRPEAFAWGALRRRQRPSSRDSWPKRPASIRGGSTTWRSPAAVKPSRR